jgi:hypothetical protein
MKQRIYIDTSIVGGYFDCVQMKNEIQAKIYAETKDMSFEELKAYLAKRIDNSPFRQRIPRLREARSYTS